jgi:hypothetical protein
VLDVIRARLAECGLELHPVKTKIVYCKDDDRRLPLVPHTQESFRGVPCRLARAAANVLHRAINSSGVRNSGGLRQLVACDGRRYRWKRLCCQGYLRGYAVENASAPCSVRPTHIVQASTLAAPPKQ